MKFLDEYRNEELAERIVQEIRRLVTRPWVLMEVCGGQTHSIVKYGIDRLLPEEVELVHGPGCPVCVTSLEMIDKAHAIASRSDVIFCSFGDMLRVPGSDGDLLACRARGADVRVVYSPLDAVTLAKKTPDKQIVFFAVGFETTAPANALAVQAAAAAKLANFSILSSQVLVPPSLASILQTPGCRVQAFLGPGHVCTIMGVSQYEAISRIFGVPIAIAGFEPADLLEGILAAVRQLEAGEARVEIAYTHAVRPEGNARARAAIEDVFEVCDRKWRGVGLMPKSGLRLRAEYRAFDAERRFDVGELRAMESSQCMSGHVLRGLIKPTECPAFGKQCTPENPLGATMVSSEGACAAYYRFGRTAGAA